MNSTTIDATYEAGQMAWVQTSEPSPNSPTWRARWQPCIVIDPPSARYPDSMRVRLWPTLEAMRDGKHGRKTIVYLHDCMPDPLESSER